jgi:ATP-dependent DNA helicase RecG
MKWGPSTEIQFLKGVGPAYAEILKKKGIYTFSDLLNYYPRTYQDLSLNKKIRELETGENVSLRLDYIETKRQRIGRTRSLTTLVLSDGQEILEAKFFKSPYRGYFDQFAPNCKVQVSGKVKEFRGRFEMAHPDISFIKDESLSSDDSPKEKITPIYPESERLNQKKIRSLIEKAYSLIEEESKNTPKDQNPWLFDPVPKELKEKYRLVNRYQAIKSLHYPSLKTDTLKNYIEEKTRAHLSLIFEEFFILEVLTALRKQKTIREQGVPIPEAKCLEAFLSTLPFKMTQDQLTCLDDILEDFKKEHPMHRMVQGDVGSGKTLVALATAFVAIKNGFQVALMAPTEILAHQHLKNVQKFLEPFGVT